MPSQQTDYDVVDFENEIFFDIPELHEAASRQGDEQKKGVNYMPEHNTTKNEKSVTVR